jgi:hypothetical protein
MNEQLLKDLWWKARIGYNEQNCDPEVLAKFAELLEKEFEAKHFSEGYLQGQSDGIKQTVVECIQLADQYGSGGAGSEFDVGYISCANTLSDEFKKRFGVEE